MEQLIAYAGTALLGVAVVAAFVAKYAAKIGKYINIAKEALDIADTVVKAVEDGKVDELEVKELVKEISDLREVLKK